MHAYARMRNQKEKMGFAGEGIGRYLHLGGVQISPGPPVLEYQKIWLLLLFSLFGA